MMNSEKEIGLLVENQKYLASTQGLRLRQLQSVYQMLKSLVEKQPEFDSENIARFFMYVEDLTVELGNPYYDRKLYQQKLNLCTEIVEKIAVDFAK